MRIIRVFPRATSYTPTDAMAFVGDPPLWRPEADEVQVSVCFSWDVEEGYRLASAWGHYYPGRVYIGGPAIGSSFQGFTPGLYVRDGVTFTSRGCNNRCHWCLVPKREGRLALIEDFAPGNWINDNNLLQCPTSHRQRVYAMLRAQRRAAVFAGGLQASLVTDEVADELRGLRIKQVFLAADTEESLRPLERAVRRLGFLGREKLRCYVLVGFDGETIPHAEARLERVWELGAMPHAQLYQPVSSKRLVYTPEWRALAKLWSRPAAMKAVHRQKAA